MPKIRKEHNDAFRARVALEAIRGEKTGAEIAREFGVHPLQVTKWKKVLLERAGELYGKGDGPREQEHAELVDQLYRQIGELKVQLDWLKKKVGSFD